MRGIAGYHGIPRGEPAPVRLLDRMIGARPSRAGQPPRSRSSAFATSGKIWRRLIEAEMPEATP
jgi:hypothetical protein